MLNGLEVVAIAATAGVLLAAWLQMAQVALEEWAIAAKKKRGRE